MKVYIKTEDIRQKTIHRRDYDVRFLDPSTNREITLAYTRPEDSEESEMELETIDATKYERTDSSESGDIAHVSGVVPRFRSRTRWYIGEVPTEVFDHLYVQISRTEDFKTKLDGTGIIESGFINAGDEPSDHVQALLIDVPKAKRRLKRKGIRQD